MITRLDGTAIAAALEEITASTLSVRGVDGDLLVPLDDVARVEFAGDTHAPDDDARCTFYLACGGRLAGELIGRQKESVIARTFLAARTALPFEGLAAIVFHDHESAEATQLFEAAFAERLRAKDVLVTAGPENPQSLRGALVELGPEGGEFIFSDRPRHFRTARIHAVVFAAGTDAQRCGEVAARLGNGDVVSGRLLELKDERLRMEALFGQRVDIPVDALVALDFRGSRIVYLSDLTPAAHATTGLIHRGWTYRKDRNVLNQPLVLGGREHAKGLGVHSRCTLTYNIDGQYETFAATIGIDDAVRPGGEVEFVVLADGRRVFGSGAVTGSDEPRDIRVPITGVERLTLTVDFGRNADVGDWADWGSARLIIPRPSS